MLIAKLVHRNKPPEFAEVIRSGRVKFDDRDGWVLLRGPIDVGYGRQFEFWAHPEDVLFAWVRVFSSFDPKEVP